LGDWALIANEPQKATRPTPTAAAAAPKKPVQPVKPPSDPEDRWVQPLRWIALAVWIAIPILGFTFQPVAGWSAGRIIWTCAVAVLPVFIVLIGYHRWRRICPLAFWNQIMVHIGRPGTRRAPDWLEKRYYFVPVGLFTLGLWLRLVWTNGDGPSVALFWILISIVSFIFGVFFTGKTWCNYICPVSFIEKIYTEPHGLRETRNSQCVKCTACKKACPDINQENGYWKEIELPSKRFAYFAYPGLVFGFYFYYWMQAGTWDYYFSGSWTNQPGVLQFAFLPGHDAATAGFFFLPLVPRALAAILTLAACALISVAIFSLLEPRVGAFMKRRDPTVDAIRVRHTMFGVAAFCAFTIFYSFAGQPTIRRFEWLNAYTTLLVVLVATLFLVRKLTRTPQAFAEQSVARNIIKRWDWPDMRPPKDLHDAYVMHTARSSERERAYAQVVEAYQEAVRETLASGFLTRADVQRLEALRNQLQIKKSDHEKVMATLAEDERALLTDPTKQASAEKRLQLETYGHALERYLESATATGTDETYLTRLRQEFGVTQEEHAAVLAELIDDGQVLSSQITNALSVAERAGQALRQIKDPASPSLALLAHLLRRSRASAIERLLRTINVSGGESTSAPQAQQLASDDEAQHAAALEVLQKQLPATLGEQLVAAHAEAAQPAADLASVTDVLRAYTADTDPYVRAIALYALAERGRVEDPFINRGISDEHDLVQATAYGLRRRGATAAADGGPMLTIEKMVALRHVPLFNTLEAAALQELAQSSTDTRYAAGDPLCIEGDPGDEVFVLLSGEATVVEGADRDGTVLRVEHPGAVIGEMAVLEETARSASVFASGDGARVLRLNGAAFHTSVEADPAVAEGVIRSLAQRVRTRGGDELVESAAS
jgi:cyclic nucleotide-binding protein